MNAKEPKRAPIDRRRFIALVAASGGALLAGTLPRARAAAPKAAARNARKSPKSLPPALEREIQKQEKGLADVLKVVRAYDLPPGSEPATLFRAMRARRGER